MSLQIIPVAQAAEGFSDICCACPVRGFLILPYEVSVIFSKWVDLLLNPVIFVFAYRERPREGPYDVLAT